MPVREQLFLSWAGLRGAVPIVLALVAFSAGAPDGQRLVDVVFVLVVLLTLTRAAPLPHWRVGFGWPMRSYRPETWPWTRRRWPESAVGS